MKMAEKIKTENIVEFKKIDAKRQIVFGEVCVPHVKDADGNFMTAETIEKMAHDFLANKKNVEVSKNYIAESFIARNGDPDFTEGSWVVGIHVPDNEVWQQIEKGELTNLAVEGKATLIEEVLKMSAKDKKEVFMKLRDTFKGVFIGYTDGMHFDHEKKEKFYNILYEAMEQTDSFDDDYLKHIPQRNGTGYYMLYRIVSDKAPLEDCFTALTFLLKNNNRNPSGFSEAVNQQVVYNVLNYMCELL